MAKIIRNEIEYSSTTSTANQINYLNTVSGLSATNVQDAIDEIVDTKASDEWINKYSTTYNVGILVEGLGTYASVMIVGCVQGIGGVAILVKITNNAIASTIDMYTGSAFSNSNLSIMFNQTTHALYLTPMASTSGRSNFVVIRCGF